MHFFHLDPHWTIVFVSRLFVSYIFNMSTFYYGQQQHQQHPHHGAAAAAHHMSNNHNGGRSRRGPKMATHQNAQRQFRGVKSMRELAEAPAVSAFRARFEAGRSFDLDDDLEFCPGLLTEDDVCSPPGLTRPPTLHPYEIHPLHSLRI